MPGQQPRRRSRTLTVFLIFGGTFLLLAARLSWLQVAAGPALAAAAQAEDTANLQLLPTRGRIVDRFGRVLADNQMAESLYALPPAVTDPPGEAAALARITGLPSSAILTTLTAHKQWVWVAHRLPAAQYQAIAKLKLPGLFFQKESQRVYPNGTLAGTTLGFTGLDGQGLDGVEYEFNKVLTGTPGRIIQEVDAAGRPLPDAVRKYTPPRNGDTVELTLDATLQYMAQRDLAATVAARHAAWGVAIAMDPRTGDLLAVANVPGFDPNHWQQYPRSRWRDPAVQNVIQPGSAFKPMVAAAAIDAGLMGPNTRFPDPTGHIRIGGHTIFNWNLIGLGKPTLTLALEQSDNVVFSQVAEDIGVARFYKYMTSFGIGRPTGVDLPGEAAGLMPPADKVRPLDLATMGFGQTLALTPLQEVTAIAAIANGGELMWPHVERALLAPGGRLIQHVAPRPVRRVISRATAAAVTKMMVAVVEKGLGQPARVPGYWVAGKTGTAQIPSPHGGYLPNSYLVSFVGFAPASAPQIVVYVAVSQPQGPNAFGSTIAGPIFAKLIMQGLHDLGVSPTRPLPVATSTATAAAGGH